MHFMKYLVVCSLSFLLLGGGGGKSLLRMEGIVPVCDVQVTAYHKPYMPVLSMKRMHA